ncbi:uncharacterized protein BT62DRAFT_923696 [Guyanagaster necrorhizus]|uniref:DUF6593 domain-containing protein n=1 Tax=Guyanagaster necrorhizus TaxID=856835 RepID=A0A9P7VI68_9AGAR|nr:uncharacterized protein BT62DRAFT_923696 [Guyanagaster necrorhizus MCA 3950]KAG7440820.1 hypothetical protein BT62DRAFT_923696 [Guyanagaster necrorhizus MCA 3950]
MTKYGIPIFLEDKSGKLTGSEFIDIHDRMRFSYRCTARDGTHTAYMIFNLTAAAVMYHPRAIAALDFGPGNSLGTISWGGVTIPMKKYLVRVSNRGRARKFVASDSQEYIWSWRTKDNQEWTCTNVNGYLVAYYSLKVPGEPPYEGSSGCSLTVDEAYGHLAAECLASLMIMRHIAEYNL